MASLICTDCRTRHTFPSGLHRCRKCGEPLDIRIEGLETAGIRTDREGLALRYADFYPYLHGRGDPSLGEGGTPLTPWLDPPKELAGKRLLFKNETLNPTWSFKDRGTYAGIRLAAALGFEAVGTVSTGNMAASVAAYAQAAGLRACILVSEGLPANKVAPIAVYGPELIMVDGDYGRLYFHSLELAEKTGIMFINSDAPARVEGSKSIAFEICEQLGFDIPEYVIVPVSAGGNLRGIVKGFEELRAAGLTDSEPRVVAAQASGCAPVAEAWRKGRHRTERVAEPETVAGAIKNPYPPSGNQVLRLLAAKNGLAVRVDDPEIISAQRLMAKAGIFGQPAAAVPLAALRRLTALGRIEAGAKVVMLVTGSGLKDLRSLEAHDARIAHCRLEDLEKVFSN